MGVRLEEDDFLIVTGKLLKLERGSFIVSSSERAARQINARKNGIAGSQSAKGPERTSSECADLEDRPQIGSSEKLSEGGKFRDLLRRAVPPRPKGKDCCAWPKFNCGPANVFSVSKYTRKSRDCSRQSASRPALSHKKLPL